jgi:hypothetical protein
VNWGKIQPSDEMKGGGIRAKREKEISLLEIVTQKIQTPL